MAILILTAENLEKVLNEFLNSSALNKIEKDDVIYDNCLLGIADAQDPYFTKFKDPQIIGDIFRTPDQWLKKAKSVISFFLPFSKIIRDANRGDTLPSVEWLHGRFRGEDVNDALKQRLVTFLKDRGFDAVAPTLDDRFVMTDDFSSNWSERHVAFVSGLGTFGLNRGLITKKGMAGRFGSVVTDMELPTTIRQYSGPFDYCPALTGRGKCFACIERCPVDAITPSGKAQKPCSDYQFVTDSLKALRLIFDYPFSACGKCQIDVPCETEIPKAENSEGNTRCSIL